MADSTPWIQFVGTALGGVLTLGGGFLAQWMTTGRDREARRVAAEEHRKRQRAEFQVKTLLEVQEVAWSILDTGRRFAASATQRGQDAGESGRVPVPAMAVDAWEKAVPRLILLVARVEDGTLREMLTALRVQANSALRHISVADPAVREEKGRAINQELLETFERANARIGEILRELT